MPSDTDTTESSGRVHRGGGSNDTHTGDSVTEQGGGDKTDQGHQTGPDGSASDTDSDQTVDIDALQRENARLRQQYERLRRNQYRKAVIALLVLGLAGFGGAALFPPVRDILVVLGAIGVFAAAVTRYISPERLIPVDIGTTVVQAHAANHASIVDELGLQDITVYMPGDEAPPRLFVPEHRSYSMPSEADLRNTFVVTEDEQQRGVAFTPSGAGLFTEFDRSRDGPLGGDPATVARQSTDALVELLEIVGTATPETDAEGGRLTVRIEDCRVASATTFDTPVASFLGVTLASGLNTPVTTEVTPDGDTDFIVTCRWDSSEVE